MVSGAAGIDEATMSGLEERVRSGPPIGRPVYE